MTKLEKQMTKLEKLKAARDAACYNAKAVADAAYVIYAAARDAYEAELEKTQEENSND